MKRAALLRRVPFRSKPPVWLKPERTRAALLAPPAGMFRNPVRVDADLVVVPKRIYVRSEPLLAEVRALRQCCRCGAYVPVDPAHSNWACHGKAGAKKADDHRIAALCRFPCHHEIDAGRVLSEVQRQRDWWEAHVRTVTRIRDLGRWPAGVPFPDLTYPHEWIAP